MMKNVARKIPVIMLVMVMAAMFMPNVTKASDAYMIKEVRIFSISYPRCHVTPDYDVSTSSTANYSIDVEKNQSGFYHGVSWYDCDEGVYLTPQSLFKANHYYRVTVSVVANSVSDMNFCYRPGAVSTKGFVSIIGISNWKDANIKFYDEYDGDEWKEYGRCELSYTIKTPALEPINEVELDKSSLTKGMILNENTLGIQSPAAVTSASSVWSRNTKTLAGDEAVTHGDYQAVVTIKTDPEYFMFTWNTKVKVFGKSCSVQSMSVDSDEITIITPVYHVACDHSGNTDTAWKNNSEKEVHYKKCTECGEEYDESAHTYDSGVDQGGTTRYTCTGCGDVKDLANGNVEITRLVVEDTIAYVGDAIPLGEIPDFRGLGAKQAGVTGVTWYEDDVQITADNAVFQAGKTYKMKLNVSTVSGFYVANQASCECRSATKSVDTDYNSVFGKIENLSVDGRSFTLTYQYKATDKITLNVSLPQVEFGMNALDVVNGVEIAAKKADGTTDQEIGDLNVYIKKGDSIVANAFKKKGQTTWTNGGNDISETLAQTRLDPDSDYIIGITLARDNYQYVAKDDIKVEGNGAETAVAYGTVELFLASVNSTFTTGSNG